MTAKIHYQGVSGAFSHNAAVKFGQQFFSQEWSAEPCDSFGTVFGELKRDSTAFAAVPLENSSIGPIIPVWDLLWESGFKIVCMTVVPVNLQLIGIKGASLCNLREIHSHPAALAQCKRFFGEHPEIRPVEAGDTAGAVLEVVGRGDVRVAAIAGAEAVIADSEVILSGVQDFQCNSTRFALLAHEPVPCKTHTVADSRMFAVVTARDTADSRLRDIFSTCEITALQALPEPSEPFSRRLILEVRTGEELSLADGVQDFGAFCSHA